MLRKHARRITGTLFLVLALLASYFRASATLTHEPYPITEERIAGEARLEDRLFLAQEKERRAVRRRETQGFLNRSAVASLLGAAIFGIWYLRLRQRDALAAQRINS
jgi:hypothetical protein